jgi:hypothetical protein
MMNTSASKAKALRPPRPKLLIFTALATMYKSYEELFLGGAGNISKDHASPCGLTVTAFDHNFFHMVKMNSAEGGMCFMPEEKPNILACLEDFGRYQFTHNDHRAKYLASAQDTLLDPDELIECDCLKTAKYALIKEYDSKPYPFTVFLLIEHGTILVPATSFPCKRNDIKKWRRGKLTYTRNTKAIP